MAQIIRIYRTCDVSDCGRDAAEHVLALGKTRRSIDLCQTHADELNKTVQPYLSIGRPAPRARKASKPDVFVNPKAVRAWAKEHGVPCPEIGIPPLAVKVPYLRWWCDQRQVG